MKPLVVLLLALACSGLAQKPPKLAPIKFTDTTLDNGLRVIISEDHYAPVYAIAVSYKVGSRDERKGRTGFAHLFEHMMYKGSENVGPGEHFYAVFTKGGSMNGTTNTDRTVYYEVLPKNQLDLGLFLEADRMRSLKVTKENLENQRQAVKEERRLGLDNQPYGVAGEKMEEMTYDNFAYQHTVIGSMADLDAASVEDVTDFFKTYYAPNNAVVALVGDLDTKETLAKVKKYFGTIPRQTAPKPMDLSEPPKTAERKLKVDDKLARLARLDIAYRVPEITAADTRAISVLSLILSGESGRLYQKLVKEKEIASGVFAGLDGRAGPSKIEISATIPPRQDRRRSGCVDFRGDRESDLGAGDREGTGACARVDSPHCRRAARERAFDGGDVCRQHRTVQRSQPHQHGVRETARGHCGRYSEGGAGVPARGKQHRDHHSTGRCKRTCCAGEEAIRRPPMKKPIILTVAVAAILAAQAPQPAQSVAGVVRYNRLPVSNETLR